MKTILLTIIILGFNCFAQINDFSKQFVSRVDLDSGLVAFLPFNGNAIDVNGKWIRWNDKWKCSS